MVEISAPNLHMRDRSLSLTKKKTIFGSKKILYQDFVTNLQKNCLTIQEEIDAICSSISLKADQISNRLRLCSELQKVFNDCDKISTKCSLFGSSLNGVGFIDSDVDIRVLFQSSKLNRLLSESITKVETDTTKVSHHFEKQAFRAKDRKVFSQRISELRPNIASRSKDVLEAMRKLLASHLAFSDVLSFASGRNCLLKFCFAGHPVEISLGNDLALLNTLFVKHLLSPSHLLSKITTAFLFVLKCSHYFMSSMLSKISSYCAFCMLISVLADLDSGFSRSLKNSIDFYNKYYTTAGSIYSPPAVVFLTENVPESLGAVLRRLSQTDFSTQVFSPYLGGVVPFTRLFIPQCTDSFHLSELNVQDPFELDHNIAGKVSKVASWRKEFSRISDLFDRKQRLSGLYDEFLLNFKTEEASQDYSANNNIPVIQMESSESAKKIVDVSSFVVVHTLKFEAKKKKKDELFVEDFKKWSFNSVAHVLKCLKNVYLCVFEPSDVLDTIERGEVGFSWPFFVTCRFEKDVWRGRRNVKQSLFGKNQKTELKDEENVSKVLFDKRTELSEVVHVQVRFESLLRGLFLKVDFLAETPVVLKKSGLQESFDTLLFALFKKMIHTANI